MLKDEVNALWAKKKTENGEQLWLPLMVHLQDTQSVIEYLYNIWLSDGQRQAIAGDLSDDEIHKLVRFLGFTHDLGKATPSMETKASYNGDHLLDSEIIEKLTRSGFAGLNDLELASRKYSPHSLSGEAILERLGVPETVGAIIGGHHGKPVDNNSVSDDVDDHTINYWQTDNANTEIAVNWQAVQQYIFNEALRTSGYQLVDEIPEVTQPQAVLLEGLLIMADWLASGEYLNDDSQTPLFPLIEIDQTIEDVDVDQRWKQAMTLWQREDEWLPDKIASDSDPYDVRWGFKARPVQAEITQTIGSTTVPGIAIIEAPMGIGKTEIALIAAEQMAYTTGRDGLFFGLPTQVTTNMMYNRVEPWLQNMAQRQFASYSIKLMHGKAQFNKEYADLPEASNVSEANAVTVNSWFSGKKSILTKFTVGTIDNLLLMGLKQKHLFLRHLGFSGKVVVIDEVHAFDLYMRKYLYRALNWLGAYHVPVIILSATLPVAKRNELLEAYFTGKYQKKEEKILATSDWQTVQSYPLLSVLDGPNLIQVTDFSGLGDQLPTEIKVTRMDLDDEALVQDVATRIQNGGIAGIIVNTVDKAQRLAKLVPDDIPKLVLHSAFIAPERTRLENELMAKIGKGAERPEKMIVIGTQVLEQSLDADFDVLYTDIAPMDLILQRTGRLHRHNISRPKLLRQPQLFVLGINADGYDKGSESVYGAYLLMKTDHFLPDKITLPTDISPLVQAVYDSKTDSEIEGIDEPKQKFDRQQKKAARKAGVFQVAEPNLTESIHGWLKRNKKDVDNDIQAAAAVRDIQESLEVILTKQVGDKDYLLDGRELEVVDAKIIAQQTIRLPHAVTFKIDQAIRELEKRTQKQYPEWQNSVWLKGSLALQLDQNQETVLGQYRLRYTTELGLSYQKEE